MFCRVTETETGPDSNNDVVIILLLNQFGLLKKIPFFYFLFYVDTNLELLHFSLMNLSRSYELLCECTQHVVFLQFWIQQLAQDGLFLDEKGNVL